MTFTDEDLGWLKDSLNYKDPIELTKPTLAALLARLEAAEKIAFEGDGCVNCPNQGWYVVPDHNTGEALQEQCQFCVENPISRFNLEEAWRKAAGKD
jgi:hypothetical protein